MKTLTVILAGWGLFALLFFVAVSWTEYRRDDGGIIIPARQASAAIGSEKTYRSFEAANYFYVTGIEGQIYYKPASISESLLLNTIRNENIIHNSMYFLIGLLVFFKLRTTTDQKSFSKGILDLFFIVALLLFCLPMLNQLYQSTVVDKLVREVTNGRYQADYGNHYNFVPLSIILILLFFLKKGLTLQEEQELTV